MNSTLNGNIKPREFKIPVPDFGMEYNLIEGMFFALQYYDDEGTAHRLYGRVTETCVNDPHFLFMLKFGCYTFITDLTIEEKEHIYNTCK